MRDKIAESKYRGIYEKANFSSINIEKLRKFLIKEKDNWFNKDNAATSESDFEYFNITNDREHVVMYGELMMVDIYSGEMWICEHTRKAYRNTRRECSLQLKPLALVIKDCHRDLGSRWNGYWLIPKV